MKVRNDVKVTLVGNKNNNEFVKNKIKDDFNGNIRCFHFKEYEDLNALIARNSFNDLEFIIYTNESNNIKENEKFNNNSKFNFYKYKEMYNKLQPEVLNYKIMKLFKYNQINTLITGLSYYEVGLREELFELPTFNIALSGQDLQYDYLMSKYLMENYKIFENLKYIVIGLSYYSFDYNLSKTNSKLCVHRYFNYIKNDKFFHDKNEAKLANLIYLTKFNYYEEVNNRLIKSLIKIEDLNSGYKNYLLEEAEKQSNMNYINTVKENIQTLKKLFELAKCRNVIPILLVNPVTSEYSSKFNNSVLKENFYSIIKDLKQDYEFIFYDYFNDKNFNNDDFFDYSHLNKKGAIKFSKLINSLIMQM